MPLDIYRYQITNDFEKLLDLEGVENISMITSSILLVFCMHVGPNRLLENDAPNIKFDTEKRLCLGFTGLD